MVIYKAHQLRPRASPSPTYLCRLRNCRTTFQIESTGCTMRIGSSLIDNGYIGAVYMSRKSRSI